jgi:hypothetical protein
LITIRICASQLAGIPHFGTLAPKLVVRKNKGDLVDARLSDVIYLAGAIYLAGTNSARFSCIGWSKIEMMSAFPSVASHARIAARQRKTGALA